MRSDRPQYIAEISGNHGGNINRAKLLISIAKESGADWVKLQTFEPEQMCINPLMAVPSGEWKGKPMQELYRKTHTPKEWHAELFAHAKSRGIGIFSTPFHPDDVEFLEKLGCPMYKIASFEACDLRLIRAVAETKKPIIISTGVSTMNEVDDALETAKRHGAKDMTIMVCSSHYPATHADSRVYRVVALRNHFRDYSVKVGLSDHTHGLASAAAATALGASMIEKHLCLSRDDDIEDAKFSADPKEFFELVETCNEVAEAITPRMASVEKDASRPLRRGFYFSQDLKAGTIIKPEHLVTSRPCLGVSADKEHRIVDTRLSDYVVAGEPVVFNILRREG